ncbi:MAG: YdbH domain-containing protein [Sphingomonas sp.]|nr:YdbH domain-containing protein [Sphingomonas sp.]
MVARRSETERSTSAGAGDSMVVSRWSWGRLASVIAIGVLIALLAIIATVWIERRPLATRFLQNELDRRGVEARYTLDRVGFRSQQVSNLVIGDPTHPDLTARHAEIQTRLTWTGSFEVYRIVARGVRLRGQLVGGKVHWGQIDKLLPPPSDKPFTLPNFALDIADSTIALKTPFGPVGIALAGSGQLSGGFKGRAAVVSRRLAPGRCVADQLRANLAVAVEARRPNVDGPVTLASFRCPSSHLAINQPRFDAKASFNESFTSVDGSGRMAMATFVAGANGLASAVGDLTYKGPLSDVRGHVKLAAQRSRLATITADRTRLDARYGLGIANGKLSLVGQFSADSAKLDDRMLASVSGPLAAAAKTPIGPVATAIGNAIKRTSDNFHIAGGIRLVNFPGGGGARINDATIIGPNGARAHISGGTGVTYYWPEARLRIDGTIATGGGGLPQGQVVLSQPRPGAPMSGLATFAPYTVNGSRLTLTPIRFAGSADGSTRVSTVAQLDGPFPQGQVTALRLPIEGRIGRGGSFAFGSSCAVVSFDYARFGALALERTRLPVCPLGRSIIAKNGSGPVMTSARIGATTLNGRLGKAPFQLNTSAGRFMGQRFTLDSIRARLGKSEAPIRFDATRLDGNFAGSGISGTFDGGNAVIGNVPLLLSKAAGKWRLYHGDLAVDARTTISDRLDNPRFYPLASDDLHLTIAGDVVRATGSIRQPGSGVKVANVNLEHLLASGLGHANLDVPGLTFGSGLQPDDLTRLTQGVIALVNGTISGSGRIDWNKQGKVTSSGDFSTSSLDLAAPFGPVGGISGTIHFNDLLGLTTAPGQVLTTQSINPGILVENGAIHYQLLPHQLVKIERGEWPFMGGTLVLHETVINFARPTDKRLTFEVIGLDANVFVSSLGFKEIKASGRFDGFLPMIFDENGGRIVGGRLDARPEGGTLSYVGAINRANLGFAAKAAFDALKDLRYKAMVVRLDGDLSGEFATKITIDQLGLSGSSGGAKLLRGAFAKVPFRFNINIRGPFRSLIQTAKYYRDPRPQVDQVLTRPLDSIPGIATEVRRNEENQTQTQTPPAAPEITTTTTPPQ